MDADEYYQSLSDAEVLGAVLAVAAEREEFYAMYAGYPLDGLGERWAEYQARMKAGERLLAKLNGKQNPTQKAATL